MPHPPAKVDLREVTDPKANLRVKRPSFALLMPTEIASSRIHHTYAPGCMTHNGPLFGVTNKLKGATEVVVESLVKATAKGKAEERQKEPQEFGMVKDLVIIGIQMKTFSPWH